MDYQLGVVDEVTYGTQLAVIRFFEYNGDAFPWKPVAGRTEGNPLRTGSRARRYDRFTPYFHHGEGTLELDVMTKGFGFWLKHMLGTVATTGVGPYTHTATEGATSSLIGKSFTAQHNVPFTPAGTNQAVTLSGGKVKKWTLANNVEENLVCQLECDFAAMSTAIALATASYPASMDNLCWVGGTINIGGSQVDVKQISVEGNNNPNVDRRRIRANTMEKEPTPGVLEVGWSLEADFESLTQYSRVHAAARAGAQAQIDAAWMVGTSGLKVTIPSARFDEVDIAGTTDLAQTLTGVGEWDGTNSPVKLEYFTTDATP